jgi:hypothetical protein
MKCEDRVIDGVAWLVGGVQRMAAVFSMALMAMLFVMPVERAEAQCGATWNTNFGNPGVSVVSAVSSIVEIPGGDLILGGSFTSIGGVSATNIARYNPSTGTYTPIGSGVNGSVSVLAVVPAGVAGAGDVIVGGRMSIADGVAVSGVARYSPGTNTWSALPGTFPLDSGNIRAIAVVPSGLTNAGDIYVGGSFIDGGGVSQAFFIVRYVASTNTWTPLGPTGLRGMANTVTSIAVIPSGLPNAGQVVIGGFFERTRNQLANTGGIVRYDPANNTFAALGTGFAGTSPQISSIAILPSAVSSAGQVFVGGTFTQAGGVAATNLASFNLAAGTWSSVGVAPDASVRTLSVAPNGTLYAGGLFSSIGGVSGVGGIASYSFASSAWSSVGGTGPGGVSTIAARNTGEVFVGGSFTSVGGIPANGIARYFASFGGPTITLQPQATLVCPGGTATFSVAATSASTIAYQWRLNGNNILGNASATTPTLTLTNVTAAGTIDCVVSSGCSVASAGVSLGLKSAPAVTRNPSGVGVCPGSTRSISIDATGTAPLSYQWRLNGININTTTNPSAATSQLTITNFQAANAGNYTCVVTNACGSATSSTAAGTLSLNTVPTITQSPASLSVCAGPSASFSVTATGSAPLSYQWRRGTTNLTNGGTISGATSATLTISSVAVGDAATDYNCVVTNSCSSVTSGNATLTVNAAISISAQPQSSSVCAGTSASFSVTASGTANPTYQWRKGTTNLTNGGNISGATTATLTISSVSAADVAANYNCVVSNPCASVTTSNAALAVNTAPSITAQPQNSTVCNGTSATFSVTASGTPAPTFQWRKGTTNLTNGGNISGATTATLTISSVSAADVAANYNCVVSNACSSVTSGNATLSVNTAPSITAQPQNSTVCAGTSATFSVTATGTPSPTFQWRKGTTNLTNGGNISGATTATLTISGVSAADVAANYNCVVSNACSSVTSGNATLVVNTAPSISAQPQNSTVCAGTTATFSVTATGTASPTFQWRKGTTNLVNGGNISGATSATLTINAVAAGDAATDYNCVVSNSCSSVTTSNAALAVNAAPSITAQPQNSTVCAGTSATFSVSATGTPSPTFQWRKGTTNLTNGGNISGATTATLTISSVAAGDAAADYNCVVSNACSNSTTSNATLSINTAPSISAQPQNSTVCAGTTATFSVTASGTPSTTFQWRKGTTNLTNGGNISGATTATLTISSVSAADVAANYNCVVSNACSSVTSGNATLTVNAAPSITAQPMNRTVCSGTSASFTVSATGTPAPTFQWRKGTTNLTNSANISGATTATLTINAAGSGDVASNYNCLITSSCGSVTTSNAALSLNATTSISQNPVSVSRCPGESATFSVTATGSGTLTYQWRRNGTNIDTLANPSAATSTLVIASVNAGSGGTYDCRVTSSICGAATSSGATLTIASCRCNPADIAFDDGSPLPPIGTPGSDNNGVTEGDYNLFFATFFDAGAACDIANDDGAPLPPFGIFDTNNGVTEGDYNLFFAIFFEGCAF